MTRDLMTVKGIGKKEGARLFRDWNDDKEGIFYYEDKENSLLIRQVLPIPKDVELVRLARRAAVEDLTKDSERFIGKDRNGKTKIRQLEKEYRLENLKNESDEEILELIKQANPSRNEEGSMAVFVFNKATKEFIALLDIESITDEDKAKINFTFSKNKVIRKRYTEKVKKSICRILIEDRMYPGGCLENIWNGKEYTTIPME